MILLNPGPVGLTPRVRRALLSPDLCHREPEFADLQDAVIRRLVGVYGLDPEHWGAVLLSGSGTSAVEAMLTSLVPSDGRVLVLENGVYGERIAAIAHAHGIAHTRLAAGWGEELAPDEVAAALAENAGVTHVAVVHHETTTGRLNALAELGALCRRSGVALLVDAVSSFGAEELACDAWGIAACAGTANKCLHGVPGIAFVLARRSALRAACRPPRSVYLDLARHHAEQERRSTAFTPGVPALYALAEALREHAEQGGWRARRDRYTRLAEQVAQGLGALGIEPYLPPEVCSVVLRSYRLPAGLAPERLHDELKKRGFVIYAGQGRLAEQVFRISTMGEISERDVERLLSTCKDVLALPGRV